MASLDADGAILAMFIAVLRTYIPDMAQSRLLRILGSTLAFASLFTAGCQPKQSAPSSQGVLVWVGEMPLGSQYLQRVREELPAYGRGRFSGHQGERALLGQLLNLELMATQARASGLMKDPRVQWSEVQALAQRQALTIKERMMPRQSLAEDTAALQEYLRDHPEKVAKPETRNAWLAFADTWSQGQELHKKFISGTLDPKTWPGPAGRLEIQQDDISMPQLHSALFDPALKEGDWLSAPKLMNDNVVVAKLESIEPPIAAQLEDPVQRAEIVDEAIRAPQDAALEGYLQQLRKRWPLQVASGVSQTE